VLLLYCVCRFFVYLVSSVVAFRQQMPADDLILSFWVAAVVFLIVHLGTALPNGEMPAAKRPHERMRFLDRKTT